MSLSRLSIALVGTLYLTGFAQAAEDSVKPPEKTPQGLVPYKPKGFAVTAAVQALQKEFSAHAKEPQKNKLRDKSDYFKTNPSPDATPELIMKGLEGSVSGGYAAEAYVKWQLLSGIEGKFPDDLVKRAVAVYRRAPSPASHPGLDHRTANRAIMGLKKERIPEIQKDFDSAVGQMHAENHYYLAYRDKLFSMLPMTYESLGAGLQDVADRAACGLNAHAIFDPVSVGLRSWAITQAKTGQVRVMADEVARIKTNAGKDAAKPYTKLVDENGIKWKSDSVLDGKKLDELIKFLDANITASGGGGLKFKDDK